MVRQQLVLGDALEEFVVIDGVRYHGENGVGGVAVAGDAVALVDEAAVGQEPADASRRPRAERLALELGLHARQYRSLLGRDAHLQWFHCKRNRFNKLLFW